jgi:hypothetical protein
VCVSVEMATAYAPMASQVMKSSLVVHSRPRGLSGAAALTRRPGRFTVKAIQPEKVSRQENKRRARENLCMLLVLSIPIQSSLSS